MSSRDLEELLLKKHEHRRAVELDWEAVKRDWLVAVEAFYDEICPWLDPFRQKGILDYQFEDIERHEEYIGGYRTRKMMLTASGERIGEIVPVAALILAAAGRIDMIGKNGSVRFLRVGRGSTGPVIEVREGTPDRDAYLCKDPKEKGYEEELMWKISTPPPNIRYIELNSETFADALLEVIR